MKNGRTKPTRMRRQAGRSSSDDGRGGRASHGRRGSKGQAPSAGWMRLEKEAQGDRLAHSRVAPQSSLVKGGVGDASPGRRLADDPLPQVHVLRAAVGKQPPAGRWQGRDRGASAPQVQPAASAGKRAAGNGVPAALPSLQAQAAARATRKTGFRVSVASVPTSGCTPSAPSCWRR